MVANVVSVIVPVVFAFVVVVVGVVVAAVVASSPKKEDKYEEGVGTRGDGIGRRRRGVNKPLGVGFGGFPAGFPSSYLPTALASLPP